MKKLKLLAFAVIALFFGAVNVNAETGNVAKVKDTEYATFKEAVEATPENGTITLLSDIDWTNEENYVATFKDNVTFDMEGHKITFKEGKMGIIFQGDNLTITDGGFESTSNYTLWIGDGTATTNAIVEDVVISTGINIYKATATLRNVTATGTGFYAIWTDKNAGVTIESGNYSSTGDKPVLNSADTALENALTVKGGTFATNNSGLLIPTDKASLLTITGGEFDIDVSNYIDEEYATFKTENGKVIVAKSVTITFSAKGETESSIIPAGTTLTKEEIEELKSELQTSLVDTGFSFDDFYADETLTTKFDFTQPINADTTVYMKLIQLRENEDESTTPEVTNPNTADINLYATIALIILSLTGLGYTLKKRKFN